MKDMKVPKVSVVIPSYNHEKYIAEAIQSVLDQTFQDFEIIITDDASTDRTVEEIKKFNDPRIKLFQLEKNQGGSYTINYCIERSHGEYIAILNSDDVFKTDKLEKQVRVLDENKEIGAVFTYAEIIDEEGAPFSDRSHFYWDIFKQPNRTRYEWLNHFFYKGNCLCHPSLLIRRHCYNDVGLYDQRYAQMPDFDMWIRLCMKYEIYIMPENLIKFRVRSDGANASGDRPEVHARAAWEYSKILENYIKISDFDLLLNIFPEITDLDENPDDQLKYYYLFLLALKSISTSHNLFSLNHLYSLLGDLNIADKLKSKFSHVDFINLTASKDPLNVAVLMNKKAEVVLLNEEVNKKGIEVNMLNEEVNKKGIEVNMLNEEVNKKRIEVNMLNEEVNKKGIEVNMLNEEVNKKEIEVNMLNEEVNMLNEEVNKKGIEVNMLNETVNKKDVYSKSLEDSLIERDVQINNHKQLENRLEILANEFRNEVEAYRLSISWRITRPLRILSLLVIIPWQKMSLLKKRFSRLIQLFINYHKSYPGIRGFRRLSNLCNQEIRKGGIKGFRNAISLYDQIHSDTLSKNDTSIHEVLLLEDNIGENISLPKDVAVHAHIFYLDLASEMRSYLENIPVKFHFYVTTDSQEKAQFLENAFSNMNNVKLLEVRVTENRGRDIFPMLVPMGASLAKHDFVLHIHTKRSPHNSWMLGGWRRYMMESLLGNPQRIAAILKQFMDNKNLGILFPDPYHPIKQFIDMPSNANDKNIEKLLSLAGKSETELSKIDRKFFPAGDMFWFRGKAIQSFIEMGLSDKHFEPEEGQVDATMAHAIERVFPYFASESGLETKSFFSSSFLSQQCSAHKFDLFYSYLEKGLIKNPILMFDHNMGGGANIYTREFVKNTLTDTVTILRIYNTDGIWFVQWIGNGDGMLFYTPSIDELFKAMLLCKVKSLIVNSLYGCPNLKEVISNIIELVRKLKISMEIKIHDFFSICPSPHLSNDNRIYCGVPQNHSVCTNCLKNNKDWYPKWYPRANEPINIVKWRKQFIKLMDASTIITFFDESSVEIFRRAIHLENKKIRIAPHTVEYFKCEKPMDLSGPLHIGILGTLTHIKGSKIVRALSEYIDRCGSKVRITVIGPDLVGMPPHVNVHGSYYQNDLTALISTNGINVILAPSIVPETFSYTISEAMIMGLPIVTFDIGAQGNRVKQYKMGKVVPLGSSPEFILEAIQSILKSSKKLKK